jgi:cell division protease FtsH
VSLAWGMFWYFTREPGAIQLRYGELKQVLQDPSITISKVRVGKTEIRGEIQTRDPLIDGGSGGQHASQPIRFVTPRIGLENDPSLQALLEKRVGPNYEAEPEESPLRSVYSLIVSTVVLIIIFLAGLFIIRWLAGGASPLTFGRSRHKLYAQKDMAITFNDVAGIDEAVAELREVVDFLKNPQKYQALGGRIPKGVLLVGPPGTGKTLLAKAVAGEANVPFFSMSGSDFVEMFVGVGAARVRDLFGQAENQAPCIIFIDELDALGKSRGGMIVGSHDEREQTLNQLLVEMDGFDSNRGVIIMAATNRPETLDVALLRPGRFDRTVVVDRPDINGREAILKVHVRHVKLAGNVDLRHVASLTPGSVGADLANLVNEAALMAARNGKEAVTMVEFDEAVERGAIGLERKSRIMREDEKLRVAHHETGHALVACALPNTHPVHKVSIIPRGVGTLGFVLQRPEDDRHLQTQSELESRIKVSLGGTIAEELIYGEISNGASSDLEAANHIAGLMVRRFGMSRLGRVYLPEGQEGSFLPGAAWGAAEKSFSEQTAREIDVEVRRILDEATQEVRDILKERRPALEAIARKLVVQEVIDGNELRQLIDEHSPGPKLVPGTLVEGRVAEAPEAVSPHTAPGQQARG